MYEQEVRDWLRSNYSGNQNVDDIEITPELKRRYVRYLTTPGIKPEDVDTKLTATEKIARSAPVQFLGDLGAGTMQGLAGAVKGADWVSGLMNVRPQLPPELEAKRESWVKDIADLLAKQSTKSSEMGFAEGSIPKYVAQGLGHAAVSVPIMSAAGIVPYSMATGGGEAAHEGKSGFGQFANAAYSGAVGLVQDRILHGIGKRELSMIPRQLLGGAAMAGVPIVSETAMKIQQGQDPKDVDWKKVTADFIQGALFPISGKKNVRTEPPGPTVPSEKPTMKDTAPIEKSAPGASSQEKLVEKSVEKPVKPKIEIITGEELAKQLPPSRGTNVDPAMPDGASLESGGAGVGVGRNKFVELEKVGEGWKPATFVTKEGDVGVGRVTPEGQKTRPRITLERDPQTNKIVESVFKTEVTDPAVLKAFKMAESGGAEKPAGEVTVGDTFGEQFKTGKFAQKPAAMEVQKFDATKDITPPDSLPPQEFVPDGMKIRQTATNTLFKEYGSQIMDMLGPEKFYSPETIEGWIGEAGQRMNKGGVDSALKRLMEKPQFDHIDNIEAMIVSGELNKANTPEAAQKMTDLAIKQAQMGTEAGRSLASLRAIDVMNAPATVAAKIFREAQKRFGKRAPELTPELTKKLMQMAEEAAKMPDGPERDIASAKIMAEIQGRVPRTIWKKLSTVQAISQLLNAKTFVRNIIGNIGLNGMEVISHYIGIPVDVALARVTGERSVALPKFNRYVKEFANGLKQGARDVAEGVNTAKSNLERRTGTRIPGELKNMFEFSAGETFKGNTLWGKLEKAVGYSLQATDRAFFEARFWDSADNIMRAKKINKFTPEIVEQALNEASRVTFRDANVVSKMLVGIKNALNKAGSPGGEFGLGELALKYPKVPGAIIKRGIEYSPFGIFESLFKVGKAIKRGNKASLADQRNAALSSARTVLGTTLAALGYGLAKAGVASGDRSDNQKLAKFEDAIGKRPYSIKGAGGWLSYDWLQPAAMPFTMGVAIADKKEADRRGQSLLRKMGNYLPDMAAAAGTSITEQPVMTGVSRLASGDKFGESSGLAGGLSSTLSAMPSSFMPTFFGQIAAVIDPKKRNIPKDFTGRMFALIANRTPGASMLLDPRKSVLGEDLKRGTGNAAADLALNLISPAIYSKIKDDPNVSLISQLYAETKDTAALPRSAQKTIIDRNRVYDLTQEQQSKLQGRVAELALERINQVVGGMDFNSISKERKLKLIKRIYDYAGKTAREEMLKIMKRKEVEDLLGD